MRNPNSQLVPTVNWQLVSGAPRALTMPGMFSASHWREIGERIRSALKASGKNQAWLARELGQTTASTAKICKQGTNSVETLGRICLLLQVSMDQIVFGNMTRLPRAEEKFVKELRALLDRAPVGNEGKQ